MPRPLIMFDFDGVLVDTAELLEREIRQKLSALGYEFIESREDFLELYQENIGVALIERGVSPLDMCSLFEHIQEVSTGMEIKLCSGIAEMLSDLAPIADMAVVSSNSNATIRQVLGRLGVLTRFFFTSGGDSDIAKVERLKECRRQRAALADRTFYVGDTAADVNEAHEAGIAAVAVTWGLYPAERLANGSPECIIRNPEELVELIRAFV